MNHKKNVQYIGHLLFLLYRLTNSMYYRKYDWVLQIETKHCKGRLQN